MDLEQLLSKLEAVSASAKKIGPSPEDVKEALARLAKAGANMTPEERHEQRRYFLYGSPNPDPETKARIDAYMLRTYGV